MKNIKYIIKNTLIAGLVLIVFGSCESSLDSVYDNPNAVTEIDDAALFANAVRSLVFQTTSSATSEFAGQYAHYYVEGSTARKPDQYFDNFDGTYSGMYSGFYGGVIRHIEEVMVITTTNGTQNEVRYAMANVISVMGFAVITDAFGEIPYTEGGKGKTEGNITPKYDTQEFIYKDMIERLGESIHVLKSADPAKGYPGSDPLFNNDLDKWVRMANSMRLRLGMRIRFADNTLSKQVVAQCLNDPLMEDYSQDAAMIQTEGNGNSWYNRKTGYPLVKMSEMMIDQLVNTTDPRLPVFVAKNEEDKYAGQLNGLNDLAFGASKYQSKSNMGDAISSKESLHYILTAAETWFLRAEAALVYDSNPAKANDLYRMGIKTSLDQWEVDGVDIINFLASPTATLTGTTSEMEEQIGIQMWVALTPNYFESWSNIRRTGYPVIAERTATNLDRGVTKGIMPKRFLYGSSEISANGTNVEEAIQRQGPNKIDTPVWWDKN